MGKEACVHWAGHTSQVCKRSHLYLLLSTPSWGQQVGTVSGTKRDDAGFGGGGGVFAVETWAASSFLSTCRAASVRRNGPSEPSLLPAPDGMPTHQVRLRHLP